MTKLIIKVCSTAAFLFLYFSALGDTGADEAIKLYYEEEYEEALEKLEPHFREDPESSHLYNYFFNAHIELERYEQLEEELEELMEDFPRIARFAVDLGHLYSLQGKAEEANEHYETIIDRIPDDPGQDELVKTIGNAFERRGETEWAIETYLEARHKSDRSDAFKYQLSELYYTSEEYEKMFDEHLKILQENEEYLKTVKNTVQELIIDHGYFDTFHPKVLAKVQESPEVSAFTELFTWLFIQTRDFEEAFRQLRSIDQRLEEDGRKLFDLADVVMNHNEFDIAEDIYQYIVDLGEDRRYYREARKGLLDVKYERVKEGFLPEEEIGEIMEGYKQHLEEFGMRRSDSYEIVTNMAEIKAFYLNQAKEAIDLLEEFREKGRGTEEEKAMAKMDQARYYTFLGRTWQATLLYGQLENDYEDHPIGREAKFRNAKLSFYRGEFEWALAQLEILKGASSDMHANNALDLSLTIRDAVGLDTTKKPLELYAEADLLKYRRQYDPAKDKMDQLLNEFPNHTLRDNILLSKAEIMKENRNFEEALAYYEELYEELPESILADEALYKAARIHIDRFDNTQDGVQLLEELIFNHPDSIFTVDARQEYRSLRGELP